VRIVPLVNEWNAEGGGGSTEDAAVELDTNVCDGWVWGKAGRVWKSTREQCCRLEVYDAGRPGKARHRGAGQCGEGWTHWPEQSCGCTRPKGAHAGDMIFGIALSMVSYIVRVRHQHLNW